MSEANRPNVTLTPGLGRQTPGAGPVGIARRIVTRKRVSNLLLALGSAMAVIGLLTAIGGFGLIFLVFAPLPFILAAILQPTRWRVASALFVLGCWAFGAFQVLT